MYVTLDQAKTTLRQRRKDFTLRRKVRDYLGELPDFLQKGPRAVLARQLATPNFDFQVFATKAEKIGLTAACPDYLGDKFCSRNPDKLALAKMTFFQGKGRNNGDKINTQRIIDFSKWDGKPLQQVETLWGEPLVDFHHRLLSTRHPKTEISDNTGWLRRMGGNPALFWPRLLALFICDGVLFENFHTEGQECRFTKNIIRPALAEVKERFGLRPLIVSLVPIKEERKPRWAWYPGEMQEMVQHALNIPAQPAFGNYQFTSEIALRGSHA